MSIAKSILADVNVWLATLVAEHPHHGEATWWWRQLVLPAGVRVTFCRLTQLGLLRSLSSQQVMGTDRMDHAQAWAAVSSVAAQDAVGFENEPDGIEEHLAALGARRGSSPGFWSDAYLAAFALAGGHRFATFDRGFRRFEELDLILLPDRDGARDVEGPSGRGRRAWKGAAE
jgi:toxin-antitoxin system PIN domain toxin